MTVKQLIEILKQEDPEAVVLVDTSSQGDTDLIEAITVEKLNVYESGFANNSAQYAVTYEQDPLGQTAVVVVG